MSRHVFKLPDLGEGTVSAEIVAWHVKPGDVIKDDQPLVEMSTDKAVVEIPAPVSGRVLTINGKPGDVIAVGSELATFDTADTGAAKTATAAPAASPSATASRLTVSEPGTTQARTPGATLRPRATSAAERRSLSRLLVQEPMKTQSTGVPAIGAPGTSPI